MKCNEDFIKCLQVIHQTRKYRNFIISYVLSKDNKLKCIAYDRTDSDSILKIEIGKQVDIYSVPEWDFHVDDHLFDDLENGYSLTYMPPMEHYRIWDVILKEHNDFEHYDSMQQYLKYCKENGIDAKTIRSLGLFEIDVMPLYIEKNSGYEIIDEFQINDHAIVLGHNKESEISYVTWKTNADRSDGYNSGNYFTSYKDASKDFIERSNLLYQNEKNTKRNYLKIQQKKGGMPLTVSSQKEKVIKSRYEVLKLFGKTVLFTDNRIRREDLPDGIYKYEVRHNDEGQDEICKISKSILVNFWGTILSKEKIDLEENGYRIIDEDKDIDYLMKTMSLKQYVYGQKAKNDFVR